MHRSQTLAPLAPLALLALAAAPLSADVIGLDNRSAVTILGNETLGTGDQYEQLRTKLVGLGHTVIPVDTFQPADLAGLDALIYRQAVVPPEELSATEIDAVQAFVLAGGGLVAIADGGYNSDGTVDNFNAVVQPFGVRAETEAQFPNGFAVNEFVTHPATLGVDRVDMDFVRPLTLVVEPTTTLSIAEPAVLATRTGSAGSGNVVFLADSTLWTDDDTPNEGNLGSFDNERLLEGVVAFVLAQPTQVTALCTVRKGTGVNPVGYACVDTPIIGSTWQTSVEVGPSTVATVVALSRGSASPGGALFTGELLLPTAAPLFLDFSVGQHAIAVPNDPTLIGFPATSQAARLELVQGAIEIQLQNAQDLLLGDG